MVRSMKKLKEYSKFIYIIAIVIIAIGIFCKDNPAILWTCVIVGALLCVAVFILNLKVRSIERKIEEEERARKKGIKNL